MRVPPRWGRSPGGRGLSVGAGPRGPRPRAREERSKRVDTGKVTKYRSEYGTIIEETHDQNNRVTDVRVTPGSTEIPYTMKNRSDRPVDNRPGADPRSTLDTPKFIEFSW